MVKVHIRLEVINWLTCRVTPLNLPHYHRGNQLFIQRGTCAFFEQPTRLIDRLKSPQLINLNANPLRDVFASQV